MSQDQLNRIGSLGLAFFEFSRAFSRSITGFPKGIWCVLGFFEGLLYLTIKVTENPKIALQAPRFSAHLASVPGFGA